MAESSLSLTFTQFANEIGHVLNYGRDYTTMTAGQQAEVTAIINRGVRQFMYPPVLPGETVAHRWSFLRPTTTLTTSAAYTTGTVAIALGVVTLTTGTFPSWAATADITVSGSTYSVNTRDSGTQVTLNNLTVTVAAGATYSIQRTSYDAPDDFGGIEGGMTYQTNTSGSFRIVQIGEGQLRDIRSRVGNQTAGKPQVFAVRPKSGMLLTGQRFEFLLWPNADAAYILTYRYSALTGAIASSSTVYPLGGMAHSETILASMLDVAWDYLQPAERRGQSRAYNEFLSRLSASVTQDRALMGRDSFGPNVDRSDTMYQPVRGRHVDDSVVASYGGTFYP